MSTLASGRVTRRPFAASPTMAVFWIVAAVVGCVIFFWGGIVSLLEAWARPEYSHGPLIPLIAGYLMLREWRDRPPLANPGSRVPGLLVVVLGVLVGLAGNLTQIPYFITYGLLITIGGLILLLAGARQGLRFWVAWVYLLFMLPLPNAMYWQLSGQLQFISSRLGVEFIQLVGIPVFLDGNVIDLGVYKLQVAEACSGLRYLFPLTSFGFLFAVLYQGPLWHKLILFFSSFPITVLMNSFRIGVIGVLVNSYGTEQAEGFLHLFEGWIIFVACILLLYLEAILLQRLTKKPLATRNILDLDFAGILLPLKNAGRLVVDKNLAAAGVLLLVSGVAWQLMPTRAAAALDRQTFAAFPMEINGWRGVPQKLDLSIEQVLGADEYLLADYMKVGDPTTVNLFSSFYVSTTDGSGIHSPEICIPGGGWEVSRWQRSNVPTGDPSAPSLAVNRAVIQKGASKQIVYYWFAMRGRSFASEYKAKFYTVWDSLTRSRADGALVRLVTPVAPGETEASAELRMQSFLAPALAILPGYIPN